MKPDTIPGNGGMTAQEIADLKAFQARINEAGQIEPDKTPIQEAKVLEIMYNATMSNEIYHHSVEKRFAGVPYKEVLSAGKLRTCATPLHLLLELENPPVNREEFNTGTAFHTMLMEPEKFEYELFDDTRIVEDLTREGFKSPRATKQYKEWYAQYLDEYGNLRNNVLRKEAFQSMNRLKKRLLKDKTVSELFTGLQCEHSIFIKFDVRRADGSPLCVKVRPDGIKLASLRDAENLKQYGVKFGDLLIVSVKTTVDASPTGFSKQCIRLGYNLTEAFYYDVVSRWAKHIKLLKSDNDVKTIFLTLEKDANILTGHYLIRPATSDFIQWGRYDYAHNLDVYLRSVDLTEGYEILNDGSSVVEITAPSHVVR